MRFSSILCSLGALLVAGCSYLIPENPSTPRYSTVMGERRMPQLNKMAVSNAVQNAEQSAPVSPIASMDVAPPSAPSFPPVEASTQVAANQQMAMNTPAYTQPTPMPSADPLPMPAPIGETRQVPVENMAEASGVPSFNSVPPRPVMSGAESDAEQLNKVRAQLERDRAGASAARDQLTRDAAAEPSLLAPTAGTVPPPAPVIERPLAPLPQPAASPTPPPVAAPAPAPVATPAPAPAMAPVRLSPPPAQPQPYTPPQSYIAPSSMPAPPPPAAMAPQQYNMPVANAMPAANMSGLQPILLRPPVAASLPTANATNMRGPAPAEMAPSASAAAGAGFNPMAASDAAFLPTSRYLR